MALLELFSIFPLASHAGEERTRPFPRSQAAVPQAILCLTTGLLLSACSKREPVSGFWGYPWGTPVDSVLADSVDIARSLSEQGFTLVREPGRLRMRHVQFGMGYGDVRLDFDSQGKLWHGAVRVEADRVRADSIRSVWREHHGREKGPNRIATDGGYTTFWSSGSTVDRDYFAPRPSATASREIRALDLFYGGCLADCPLYSVRLLVDGRALFRGIRDVEPLGGFAGSWATDSFAAFESSASDPALFTLEPFYSATSDVGTASRGLHLHFADGETITSSSAGQSGPPLLEDLVRKLDSIATGVIWKRSLVSWDTLDLAAQRWVDLDSLERLAER